MHHAPVAIHASRGPGRYIVVRRDATLLMSAKDLFLGYIKAYNEKDVGAMLTFFDDACVFESILGPVGYVMNGKVELKTHAWATTDAFATREQRVISLAESRGRTVAEIEYRALLRADLSPELRAGTRLELRGGSICQFAGERIIHLSEYFGERRTSRLQATPGSRLS